MGNERVGISNIPENTNNGSVDNNIPFNFSKAFHEALPKYMAMGMSPDEFWNGDLDLAKAYRDAFEIKKQMKNEELWLQGLYIYEALCDSSPLFRTSFKGGQIKPIPYRNKPYELTVSEQNAEKQSNYNYNLDMVKTWAQGINNKRGE